MWKKNNRQIFMLKTIALSINLTKEKTKIFTDVHLHFAKDISLKYSLQNRGSQYTFH